MRRGSHRWGRQQDACLPNPALATPQSPTGSRHLDFEGMEEEREHFFISGQGRDGWKLPTSIAPASLYVPACLLGKISLFYRDITMYIYSSQQHRSQI